MTPERFRRCLAALDTLLSLRWGPSLGQWVIERTGVVPETELWFLKRRLERGYARYLASSPPTVEGRERVQQLWEELQSGVQGKRVILFTPELTDRIYTAICASDMKRYGGYARIADEIEAREEQAARLADRAMAGERDDLHREAFDVINFLERKRSTQLAHGIRDFETLLG
jgi:hypothetical protein